MFDRKPQSMRLQSSVEIVEDNPGLDGATLAGDVQLQDAVEIFRAIDDKGRIDGLPSLRSAGPSRQHAYAFLTRKRQRMFGFLH